jgi:hypothetical protein
MNTVDNLLVRACKGKRNSIRLLRKIINRGYLLNIDQASNDIVARILLNIVIDYDLIPKHRMANFIAEELRADEQWKRSDLGIKETDHSANIIKACASVIRLSKIDKFEGYRIPRRFRD